LRCAAICLAACVAAPWSSSAQTGNTSGAASPKAIETIVTRELALRNLPGAAIAITRGGQVVQVSGYGRDSNGRPVTQDTPFYIGSASKAMTAVAVMQLVEAGRIELDAPVRRYLPEFTLADPRVERITVRQLLNHTSGMWEVGFRQWSFPQPASLRSAVARLDRARLAADPGQEHRYFNPNYSVAARLVEEVSDEAFDAYLRNHLFAPLGMRATKTVDFVDEARDGPALGYVFAFGHGFRAPGGPFFINAAGGVVTTATDMAQWVAAQANGGLAPMARGSCQPRLSARPTRRLRLPVATPLAGTCILTAGFPIPAGCPPSAPMSPSSRAATVSSSYAPAATATCRAISRWPCSRACRESR